MQLQAQAFDGISQDVRAALRAVRHGPAFTAWVVGSLAVGMAVTVAALALLNATLLTPFPGVADQPRLVRVSVSANCGRPDCWQRMFSPADYEALQHGLASVQGLAAYSFADVNAGVPEARLMRAIVASPNYFDVLGVQPAAGRVFDPADVATSAPVAVLSFAGWTREFGGDPTVIGRSIRIGDLLVQVIGVAPRFFAGVDRTRPGTPRSMTPERGPDLWLPVWLTGQTIPLVAERQGQGRNFQFVGRLAPGAELAQVEAEAAVLATRLATSRSATPPATMADVRKVWRVNPNTWRLGIAVILPVPILVLLIACVNAASLMIARGSQREREIAIRLAIGAGRRRVVRQLLIESAVLALAATSIAVALASFALQFASTPLDIPIAIDFTVLGLTVLAAAVTTLAFGLAPALRVSALRPSSTLGATARGDARPRDVRARRVLVTAQVALSLALLATAWQLVATVRGEAVAAGTPAERLLVARFDLRPLGFAASEADAFYRSLAAAARRLPGVESVGLARPTAVWALGQPIAQSSVVVWREADRPEDDGQTIAGGYAGADLFEAVGLRLRAGRPFSEADRQGRPQVAIVNESAAAGAGGARVGATVHIAAPGRTFTQSLPVRIVGIVEASREPRLERGEPPTPRIYLPSPIEPEPALALYLRTRDSAAAAAPLLRELVGRVSPRVPIAELATLDELNERSYATQLWLARAAGLVGIIGVLLATAGLYGVASYVVAMRAREIAIRMAIGARPRAILTMVLGQSLRLALIGLALGSGGAAVASRVLQSEYHGVRDVDTAAFAAALALFLAAMLAASTVPAFRAARINPIDNLKDA